MTPPPRKSLKGKVVSRWVAQPHGFRLSRTRCSSFVASLGYEECDFLIRILRTNHIYSHPLSLSQNLQTTWDAGRIPSPGQPTAHQNVPLGVQNLMSDPNVLACRQSYTLGYFPRSKKGLLYYQNAPMGYDGLPDCRALLCLPLASSYAGRPHYGICEGNYTHRVPLPNVRQASSHNRRTGNNRSETLKNSMAEFNASLACCLSSKSSLSHTTREESLSQPVCNELTQDCMYIPYREMPLDAFILGSFRDSEGAKYTHWHAPTVSNHRHLFTGMALTAQLSV